MLLVGKYNYSLLFHYPLGSLVKAEYMAIKEVVKEVIWLRGLIGQLYGTQKANIVYCDNQSAIFLTKDRMFHDRMKCINVHYHFLGEIIARENFVVSNIISAPMKIMKICLPKAF